MFFSARTLVTGRPGPRLVRRMVARLRVGHARERCRANGTEHNSGNFGGLVTALSTQTAYGNIHTLPSFQQAKYAGISFNALQTAVPELMLYRGESERLPRPRTL
jgi:hypothetical protein